MLLAACWLLFIIKFQALLLLPPDGWRGMLLFDICHVVLCYCEVYCSSGALPLLLFIRVFSVYHSAVLLPMYCTYILYGIPSGYDNTTDRGSVLVGRYHAVGGRRPRGPHIKANGTFPPILSLTITIQTYLARSLQSPSQHSAIGGHAHMPTKTEPSRQGFVPECTYPGKYPGI